MRKTISLFICIVLLSTACVSEPNDGFDNEEVGEISGALVNGTADSIALLDFLNDPKTTLEILDIDAKLNARAARNLIAYRDGWDRIPGTYDDNLFNTAEEVDAVRWIGPSALGRLVDYVNSLGLVPVGDDLLGTWDKVSYSVFEAEDTLALVNDASHEFLDITIALDRRAADAIVAAQPVQTIEELAGLPFVGKSALNKIKAAASTPDDGPGIGATVPSTVQN